MAPKINPPTLPAAETPTPKSPFTDSSGGYAVPVWDNALTFTEVGSTGLRQYSGWIREEFLLQLQGRQAARVYREMLDNSPDVGGAMLAITGAMRKVAWRTDPADDTPEAQEMADFAESLRFDMSGTWEDFVAEALSILAFGFAPHKIVYKRHSRSRCDRWIPTNLARASASLCWSPCAEAYWGKLTRDELKKLRSKLREALKIYQFEYAEPFATPTQHRGQFTKVKTAARRLLAEPESVNTSC